MQPEARFGVLLTVAYDGARFSGFARQPAARTVGVIANHLGLTPESLVTEDLRRFKQMAERSEGASVSREAHNAETARA